jgi:hypothetical protein
VTPIRQSGKDEPDKNAGSLQWAGLPIEYWIDLGILEHAPLWETLSDLCYKFPEQAREYHISVISARLKEHVLNKEIRFYLQREDAYTDRRTLTTQDGIARLPLPETWDCNSDEYLIACYEKRTLRKRIVKLWTRITGRRGTGSFYV